MYLGFLWIENIQKFAKLGLWPEPAGARDGRGVGGHSSSGDRPEA